MPTDENEEREITTKSGIVLSPKNLETFRKKSEFFIPRCFGGYDPEDPVCKNFCFRACRSDLDPASWRLEEEMNERASHLFFRDRKFQKSCQEKKEQTEKKLEETAKKLEKLLKDSDQNREFRDRYYLAQESKELKRVPVGKVRDGRAFKDFSEIAIFYLEIRDKSYIFPYGSYEAAGRLWELIPGGAPPDDGDVTLAFAKSISPKLPKGQYRLEFINQKENESGNLVITARIIHGKNKEKISVEVFQDSAMRRVKMDDLGIL